MNLPVVESVSLYTVSPKFQGPIDALSEDLLYTVFVLKCPFYGKNSTAGSCVGRFMGFSENPVENLYTVLDVALGLSG